METCVSRPLIPRPPSPQNKLSPVARNLLCLNPSFSPTDNTLHLPRRSNPPPISSPPHPPSHKRLDVIRRYLTDLALPSPPQVLRAFLSSSMDRVNPENPRLYYGSSSTTTAVDIPMVEKTPQCLLNDSSGSVLFQKENKVPDRGVRGAAVSLALPSDKFQ